MCRMGAEIGNPALVSWSGICKCVICDAVSDLMVSSGSTEETRMDLELIVNYLWSAILRYDCYYSSASHLGISSFYFPAGKLWTSVLGRSMKRMAQTSFLIEKRVRGAAQRSAFTIAIIEALLGGNVELYRNCLQDFRSLWNTNLF